MNLYIKVLQIFIVLFSLVNATHAAGSITFTNNSPYEIQNATLQFSRSSYSILSNFLPHENFVKPDAQGIFALTINLGFAKYEFHHLEPLNTTPEASIAFSLAKDGSGLLTYTTPEAENTIEVQGALVLQADTRAQAPLEKIMQAQTMDEIRALGATPSGARKENLSIPVSYGDTVWIAEIMPTTNMRNPFEESNIIERITFLTFRSDAAFLGALDLFKNIQYRPWFSQYSKINSKDDAIGMGFWLRDEGINEGYDYFAAISYGSLFADVQGNMKTLFLPNAIYDTAFDVEQTPVIMLQTSSSQTLSFSLIKDGSSFMYLLKNTRERINSSYPFHEANIPDFSPSPVEDILKAPSPQDAHTLSTESTYVLYPKDADLRFAKDVIIEPSVPPYNLGGWKNSNIVIFPVVIKEAGTYSISINYSRNTSEYNSIMLGVTATKKPLLIAPEQAPKTSGYIHGTGAHTWANYRTAHIGSLQLEEGQTYLMIYEESVQMDDYVINLRELHLKKEGQAPKVNEKIVSK